MKKACISVFSISLLLLSCGDSKEKRVDETGKTIATGIPENKFESADFIDKYNAYIDFGNSYPKSVNSSNDSYFRWADYDNGPKGEKTPNGITTIYNYPLEKLAKAFEKGPEIKEIDGLMKIVYDKAIKLQETVQEAHDYYDIQDYKDDNFEKGELFHKRLVTDFEEYYKAYDTMNVEFQVLQDELFVYDAEKYKKNGEVIKYDLMMSLHEAERILFLIGNLDGPELKTMDLKKYDSKMADFRKIYNELVTYSNDEEKLTKELTGNVFSKSKFKEYLKDCADFIRESRSLKERIEKNNFNYSIVHPNIPDKGSPAKLSKTYSEMISDYNGMM